MNIYTSYSVKPKPYQSHDVKWKVLIKDKNKNKNKNIFTPGIAINVSRDSALIETLGYFSVQQIFPLMINAKINEIKRPIYTMAEAQRIVLQKHRYQIDVSFKQILPKDKQFLENLEDYLI
ncbi:hypothetical protein [Spartinivicinus poritis]|uniref:PilZ domain-containing protein n=1 Tax=Spartinivicinus poritis TaxID=2994640 RepID=A0ABT5UHI7_9GAMM|nr:hypothetical protein [Spartinivicinus sp. A2-2]MDE1465675.1 hypothetical protein [Spartinivicinus sp. A2-2]